MNPSRLKSLFSPRLTLQTSSERRPAPFGLGPHYIVISRSLCHFRSFDLAAVPAREREGALELRLQRWSSFASPAFSVAWSGATAQAWTWDATRGEAGSSGFGLPAVAAPESRFYAQLTRDGSRLLRCVEGFEGQVWRAGALLASHWWPEAPDQDAWTRFLRGAGLPPDEAPLPEAVQPAMLTSPWGGNLAFAASELFRSERLLWQGLAVVAAFAVGFEASLGARGQNELAQVREQLDTLGAQARPVIESRRAALEDAYRVKQLLALQPAMAQGSMIEAATSALLPALEARVLAWNYAERELSFVLERALDPSQVVRAYQSLDWVEEVSATPSPASAQTEVRIRLRERANG